MLFNMINRISNYKINRILLAVLFACVSVFNLSAQDITVKGNSLSKDSILVGDQVVWRAILQIPQGKNLTVEPYDEAIIADTSKIDLIHGIVLDTLQQKNGLLDIESKLFFTSFDSGYYKLPMPLFIVDGDTIKIEMPSISVNTIQVDTTGFQMYDIKGQIGYPITFNEVFPWVILVIFILILIYAVYRYIKYRKENKDFFGKPVVVDPPHIVALRELDKLRSQKLWQNGKEKQFYTQVADTIRLYLEGRYKISAMEKTSAEILNELKENKIDTGSYNELNTLFTLSDLVKFAKYTPSEDENENSIPMAVRFVNTTFMEQMEEEK